MPDLDVRASGEHAYDVTVTGDDGASSHHRLTVPGSVLSDLGAEPADEPIVVRRALELLVERDGGPLPADLSLAEAQSGYPGLTDELRATLRQR